MLHWSHEQRNEKEKKKGGGNLILHFQGGGGGILIKVWNEKVSKPKKLCQISLIFR